MKYLMLKYRWFVSYNFVMWIIHLQDSLSHPNVSEFHLLSYLTPIPLLFPLTDTLDGSSV